MRGVRAAPAAAAGPVLLFLLCVAGAVMCDPVTGESSRETVTQGAVAREPVHRTGGVVPGTVVVFDASVFNPTESVVQIPSDRGVGSGSSASNDITTSDSMSSYSTVHNFVVTQKSVTGDVKPPARRTRDIMNPNVLSDSNRRDENDLLSSDATPSSGLAVNSFTSVDSSVVVSERLRNSPQDIRISSKCRKCPEVSVKFSDESAQEKSSRTMEHIGVLVISKQIVNTNKEFKDDGRKKPPDKLKNSMQKISVPYNNLKIEQLNIPRHSLLSTIISDLLEFQTNERTDLDKVERDGENNRHLGNSRNAFTANNLNRIMNNIDVKTIVSGRKWGTPQIKSGNDVVPHNKVKSPITSREGVNHVSDRPGTDGEINNEAVNDQNKRASINLPYLSTVSESYNEAKEVAEIKDKVKRNFTAKAKRTVLPFNRSERKFYQVLEGVVNKSKTNVVKDTRTSRDNNYSDVERAIRMMDYEVTDKGRSVRSVNAADDRVKIEWNGQNAAKNRDDRVKMESSFLQDDSIAKGEMHVNSTENILEEVGKIENQGVTRTVQDDPEMNSETETIVKIENYYPKTKETESSSNSKNTQDTRELKYGYSTLPTNVLKLIPTDEQEEDFNESRGTETYANSMTQFHLHPETHQMHETHQNRMKYVPNNDYVMLSPNGTEMHTSTETSEANEGLTERSTVHDISETVVDDGLEISQNSNLSIPLKTKINASHIPFISLSNVTIYHISSIPKITDILPEISGSTERSKVTNELTSTLPLTSSIMESPLPTARIKTPHSPAETTFANVEEMLAQASTEQKIVIERPSATEEKLNLAREEATAERPEVRHAATQHTEQNIESLSGVKEVIPLSEVIESGMIGPKVEYTSSPGKTQNGMALESRSFVSTNLTLPDLEIGSGTIEEVNSQVGSESRNITAQGTSIDPKSESNDQTTEEMSSARLNSGNSSTVQLPSEHELESRNSTSKPPLQLVTGENPKTLPSKHRGPVSTLLENATHQMGVVVVEDNVSGGDTGVKYTGNMETGTRGYPKSPPQWHPVSPSTLTQNNMTHGIGESLRNSDAKPNSTPSNQAVPTSTSASHNITHAMGVAMIESNDNGTTSNSSSTDHTEPESSSASGAVLHALGVAMIEGSGDDAGSSAASAAVAAATAAAAPPQFDLLDRHLACAQADALSGPANPSRCTYEWDAAGGDLPLVRCDLVAAVNGDNQNITALISNSGKFQALPGERTPSGRLCLYPVSYAVVRSEALGELSGSVLRDDPLLETLRSERDKQTLTVVLSHGFRQVALRLRHDAIGPRGLLNKDPCRGCTPEVWIFQYKKDISVARLYLNRAFALSMLFEPAYVNLAKFWLQRLKPEAFLEELEVHGGESWGNPGTDLLPTLGRLRRVDLSENGISEIPLENFERNPWIEELFLARNKFSTVPAGISLLTNLHILDLSGNLLTTQGLALTLQPLTELRKLNLSYVPLRDFEVLSPEFVSHESSYEIDSLNATSYDDMLPQLQVLDVSRGSIRSVNSPVVQRLLSQWPRMRELHLARNPLGALLADLPARLPALQVLDLSGCGLRAGPSLRLAPGQRLLRLDVSSNALDGPQGLVARDAAGRGVARTDLRGNAFLLRWPADAFAPLGANASVDLSATELAFLDRDMLHALQVLRAVDLGGNPIDCSRCAVLGLQEWLGQEARPKVLVLGEDRPLACRYPAADRGRPVVDLQGAVLDACRQAGGRQGVVAAVCVAVAAAACGALALLALRFRLELTYVVHVLRANYRVGGARRAGHLRQDAAAESEFDAFVCYSKHDRAWVLGELLPRLEGSNPRYRLCLHERDFPLGSLIVQNIVECMERSRRTLMVLTPSFVDSQWCQWELEMATHRLLEGASDFLVLVELERLETRSLPRLLRILLETRTFLEWPAADAAAVETAWQRLRAALGPPLCASPAAATPLALQPPPATAALEAMEMASFVKTAVEVK